MNSKYDLGGKGSDPSCNCRYYILFFSHFEHCIFTPGLRGLYLEYGGSKSSTLRGKTVSRREYPCGPSTNERTSAMVKSPPL